MSLSFPGSPSVGDRHTVGDRTWEWTAGGTWDLVASPVQADALAAHVADVDPHGDRAAAVAAAQASSVQYAQFTAKGGLVVGTGPGTVAELGVGAPGTQPVAHPAAATGVAWSVPTRSHLYRVGEYTAIAARVTDAAYTLNRLSYLTLVVPYEMTFDRIAIYHASGTANPGSVVRFGQWSCTGDMPDALVGELGTADLSTAAATFKSAVINLTLAPGMHCFGSVLQWTGTNPTVATASAAVGPIVPSADVVSGFKFQAGVSGSLPDPAVPAAGNSGGMALWLRRSA